jgi:hypothetical protein
VEMRREDNCGSLRDNCARKEREWRDVEERFKDVSPAWVYCGSDSVTMFSARDIFRRLKP